MFLCPPVRHRIVDIPATTWNCMYIVPSSHFHPPFDNNLINSIFVIAETPVPTMNHSVRPSHHPVHRSVNVVVKIHQHARSFQFQPRFLLLSLHSRNSYRRRSPRLQQLPLLHRSRKNTFSKLLHQEKPNCFLRFRRTALQRQQQQRLLAKRMFNHRRKS